MSRSSPKFVARIASLIAAVLSSISVWLITKNVSFTALNFVAVFLFCYIVFFLLLKEFIHDRIKLIYKNIYRFKTHKNQVDNVLDRKSDDPIGEVSKEVVAWMIENRKEVDELKRLENYRREFLGNVSHELKTPIQNIQGYIHTLLDGALDDNKVNELFLRKAAQSSDRLVELVDDLTNISTIESGQVLDLQPVDMLKLTEEVLEIVENQAQEKSIVIKFKKQNPKSVMVLADRAKVRRVLVNLIICLLYTSPSPRD